MTPDPALIEAMIAADKKYYEQVLAQYGAARASSLSELANLGHLAKLMPLLAETVENLIPHTIRGFGIELQEGLKIIRCFQENRRTPVGPRRLNA